MTSQHRKPNLVSNDSDGSRAEPIQQIYVDAVFYPSVGEHRITASMSSGKRMFSKLEAEATYDPSSCVCRAYVVDRTEGHASLNDRGECVVDLSVNRRMPYQHVVVTDGEHILAVVDVRTRG